MAGESARAQAANARARADRLIESAERWEKGAEGEAATAAVLNELGQEWFVWHDLAWPGRQRANLDHVVIGPTGVFVIDAKNWSGDVAVRDGVLRQNGYRRDVGGGREAAAAMAGLVPSRVPVCHSVICLVQSEPMIDVVSGSTICSPATLLQVITERPAVLAPAEVSALARAVRDGARSNRLARPRTRSRLARPARPRRSRRRRLVLQLLSLGLSLVTAFAVWELSMTLVERMGDSIVENSTVESTK